jgi:signal transduction histidine kinase
LLGNALAHGGQERPIRLRVDGAAANEVRLQVCNEGVIPDAARDTLFQPFQRGEKSGEGGLGLGLYIVDQIVRGHGGRIEVTSDAAQGTCFEVVLPRYVKRSETSADADPSPPLRAFH